MSRLKKLILPFVVLVVLCQSQAVFSQGFNLNFNAEPTGSRGGYVSVLCNMPGIAQINCDTNFGFSPPSNKAFVQELVVLGGETYYHLIVGQPADGFAQETYIKTLTTISYPGADSSDSSGKNCFFGDNFNCLGAPNNAKTPLDSDSTVTGNGSGNPNRVVMRQIMQDSAGEFSQEFLKANLLKKPVITQVHKNAEIEAKFTLDMSNSDYNAATLEDNKAFGILNNSVKIPNVPFGGANYDYATHKITYPSPKSVVDPTGVTGGLYTYATTTPNLPGGIYYYDDGGNYPVATINWETFRDPAQN